MLGKLFIFFIYAYRALVSPFMGNCCRFYPSCSQYAIDATRKYGFFKGLYLSLRRICRCHPFHRGGYDPA